jgi:hypothetical protein
MSSAFAAAVSEAGGAGAAPAATAHLRGLLLEELRHGRSELPRKRSGYERPVAVAVAPTTGGLLGVAPVDVDFRADPDKAVERAWLVVAGLVGAMTELASPGTPGGPQDLGVRAGSLDGFLVLFIPGGSCAPGELDDLVPVAFEEQIGGVDRLRAIAAAVPEAVLAAEDLRDPIGATHPLRVAEAVGRLGGRPADAGSVDAMEDMIAAILGPADGGTRPHEDPDPARRVARRILQRLNGMGKWGGYHTEFAHLPRGFAGNERELAMKVGEALLASGLLREKPSVGQRHVFLNPRRARDIHRLIDEGAVPGGLRLPN